MSTLKSQLALINHGITKEKNKNILLQKNQTFNSLDDASTDIKGENLFSKILEFPLISTNSLEKNSGSWAKLTEKKYLFFLGSQNFEFEFDGLFFKCLSTKEMCEKL